MSIKRLVLGSVILSTLMLASAALAAEEAAREPQAAGLEAGVATSDGDAASAEPAVADCEATNASNSERPSADLPFETGESQIFYAADKCGPWQYIGCCPGNAKKQKRECSVGPDKWTEYTCSGTCPN